MEEWKDIPNYEGRYQASSYGQIKSFCGLIDGRILKPYNHRGYLSVKLRGNKKKSTNYDVHQLMAMAFLNHTPSKYSIVVDHIDNNPLNNNVDNLQLISHRENISKGWKIRNTSSEYTGVRWDSSRKKWRADYVIKGKSKFIGRYTNEIEASNAYQQALREL